MKLDLERPKRPRTTFSEEQLRLLEEAFQQNGYLTGEARMALASRLALSDTQRCWTVRFSLEDKHKYTDYYYSHRSKCGFKIEGLKNRKKTINEDG
ncbi:homeobox domain protein, partial [Ostertagia ostertagi]